MRYSLALAGVMVAFVVVLLCSTAVITRASWTGLTSKKLMAGNKLSGGNGGVAHAEDTFWPAWITIPRTLPAGKYLLPGRTVEAPMTRRRAGWRLYVEFRLISGGKKSLCEK
jgi:hypothetical protein